MAKPSEHSRRTSHKIPVNTGRKVHVRGGRITERVKVKPVSLVFNGQSPFKDYDPDKDAAPQQISNEDYYKRGTIARNVEQDGKTEPTKFSGTLAVESGRGVNRHVCARRFDSWDQHDKIRMTEAYRLMAARSMGRKLTEVDDPWAYDSPEWSGTGKTNNEYTPLLLGPYGRQQYQSDLFDGMSKSYEALHHNPIAKAMLRIYTNFVIGSGIKVVCANPLCQQIWDEFDRRVNYSDKAVKIISKELFGIGEIFQHKTRAPGRQRAGIALLDASTVHEIVTNPRNSLEAYYLHRQFPTPYQMYTVKGVPPSEYVIEQIPAEEWTQVMVNNTLGEKRGRSDLFSVLGWLKRLKDYANAKIIAAQIQNAIVMRKTIAGTDADLSAIKDDTDLNEVPAPASVLLENEAIKSEWIGPPGTGEGGSTAVGEFIRSIISVALNLPPEYLGVQSTAMSRSAGLLRAEPAGRLFESRQAVLRACIMDAYNFVIGNAIIVGPLPKMQPKKSSISRALEFMRQGNFAGATAEVEAMSKGGGVFQEPIDTSVEVIFPEIQPEDRGVYLKDMAAGRAQRFVSHETSANLWAQKMGLKGYDYESEQEKMKAETEREDDDLSDVLKDTDDPAPPGGAEDTANHKRNEKETPAA